MFSEFAANIIKQQTVQEWNLFCSIPEFGWSTENGRSIHLPIRSETRSRFQQMSRHVQILAGVLRMADWYICRLAQIPDRYSVGCPDMYRVWLEYWEWQIDTSADSLRNQIEIPADRAVFRYDDTLWATKLWFIISFGWALLLRVY